MCKNLLMKGLVLLPNGVRMGVDRRWKADIDLRRFALVLFGPSFMLRLSYVYLCLCYVFLCHSHEPNSTKLALRGEKLETWARLCRI